MAQTSEPQFDPHASIKRLAEAELPCSEEGEKVGWKGPTSTNPSSVHTEFGYLPFQDVPHAACGGTGRTAPFALLRVDCPYEWHRLADPKAGEPCPGCKGAGWVPEGDVEKACHRLAKAIQELDPGQDVVVWWYYADDGQWYWNNPRGENIKAGSYEEAVIRAAEAWLEEKP